MADKETTSESRNRDRDGHSLAQSWSQELTDLLSHLNVTPERGIDEASVKERRRTYGANVLRQAPRRSPWSVLIDQFRSLVILLLTAAAVVSFVAGQWVEAVAVAIAILLNTLIGFVTELRAVRSMEALRRLSKVTARVRRGGTVSEMAAAELVVGDIVVLEAGDVVSADLRLVEANKLRVNESPLTGESVPVSKSTDLVDGAAELSERTNMVFKGTSISHGSGAGVVVAVGQSSELGQIQKMTEEAEEEITPLEKRLDRLAHSLVYLTLGLTAVVALLGIFRGKDIALMIKSAVALAVAAIPEGLPIVATVALARGMYHMARRNAVVNKLASVETLGATSVIGTDKTGTLTENRMTASRLVVHAYDLDVRFSDDDGKATFEHDGQGVDPGETGGLRQALTVGVLCNNASLAEPSNSKPGSGVGDPMEVALLDIGHRAGLARGDLIEDMPEIREEAFDPETNMMATIHESDRGYYVAVKGAPESVIETCTSVLTENGEKNLSDADRQWWFDRNEQLAADGLRVLALATRTMESEDDNPYDRLELVGLVGLLDPARGDVPAAISHCHDAGINVVMITGDQPGTARKIAVDVGLTDDLSYNVRLGKEVKPHDELDEAKRREIAAAPVFARVNPRQKLDLIDIHQKQGHVVAMIGDGVNDAPALKEADIGVAMGRRGTQVAKEAADMILQDDAFPTIVAAVRHGRLIFSNIRKFVLYLLSGNVSEIIAVAVASMVAMPLPLLPLQILFLNVVLDVFPALALGLGTFDPGLMKRPPRRSDESVMTRQHWTAVAIYGFIISPVVLASLLLARHWLDLSQAEAVTVSFLTLALSRLWHVFNMRDNASPVLSSEIARNGFIWLALGICVVLLANAVYTPTLSRVLELVPLGGSGYLLVFVASLVPLILGQLAKKLKIIRV